MEKYLDTLKRKNSSEIKLTKKKKKKKKKIKKKKKKKMRRGVGEGV